MPLAAIAAIGAIGSVAGGAIAAHGAGSAAKTQADAALSAAQIQAQQDQKALDFQKGTYGNQQQEMAPYLNVGYGGLANLAYLAGVLPRGGSTTSGTATLPSANGGPQQANPNGLPMSTDGTATSTPFGTVNLPDAGGVPTPGQFGVNVPNGYEGLNSLVNTNLGEYGSLLKPFNGVVDEKNDPGYQFRLNEGLRGLQNTAAAHGNLLSGNTLQSLNQFNQDYASSEYQNTFNRYYQQQNNTWDKLSQLAGIGQSSTAQSGAAGQAAANNITNILGTSGTQIGNQINNAGAARASGYAANGNIWGSTVSGLGGQLASLYALKNIGGGGIPSGGYQIPDSYYGY